MKALTAITRLGSEANAAVVQLPERLHPGVVIQGDSLRNISNLLCDATAQLNCGDYEEAAGVIEELREIIAGYVAAFDAAVVASNSDGSEA
jgi:hypothetical protein